MLTFNRPQMIGRAIESVQQQTVTDWELLIVQDGDNQETAKLVAAHAGRDARIRFLRRGVVGTIAEASNYGLRQARGRYIAILDDDDRWSAADKLARQIEFLDTRPDYVGIGGGYIVVDQNGNHTGRFSKPERDEEIRSRALIANPIANSTAVVRRIVNGQPVLYDEAMRGYADWDFWLEMGRRGKLHNFPDILAYYTLWPGGGSFQNIKGNAQAGLKIIGKHRAYYRGYYRALASSLALLGFAYLPDGVKRVSYHSLSTLKKALTASRASTTAS
jgi:glycosyltransferase involved in cell wall biosynthesis